MKKTLTLAAVLIAIASYGGNVLFANAQTAAPDQAALQQSLDDAKATLVNLQMQEGIVPSGDQTLSTGAQPQAAAPVVMPATSAMTLSSADIAAMNTALSALAGVLTNLETKIASNPQLTTTDQTGIATELQGIGQTLAAIVTEAQTGGTAMAVQNSGAYNGTANGTTNGSGIAQANPVSAAVAPSQAQPTITLSPNQGPTPTTGQSAATAPAAAAAPAAAPTDNIAPQVAAETTSAFSFSKLNWPLIIVIVLIVAAIAIWLWWDDGEDKKPVVKMVAASPAAPQKPVTMASQTTKTQTVTTQTTTVPMSRPMTSVQTPLSAAIDPQMQR